MLSETIFSLVISILSNLLELYLDSILCHYNIQLLHYL